MLRDAARNRGVFCQKLCDSGKSLAGPAATVVPFAPYGCAPRGMLREANPLGQQRKDTTRNEADP
jgi:hypothetical protein